MINIIIGIFCLLIATALAIALLVHALQEFVRHAYDAGRERGRLEAEKWWTEQGMKVDHTLHEIWREEEEAR